MRQGRRSRLQPPGCRLDQKQPGREPRSADVEGNQSVAKTTVNYKRSMEYREAGTES